MYLGERGDVGKKGGVEGGKSGWDYCIREESLFNIRKGYSTQLYQCL